MADRTQMVRRHVLGRHHRSAGARIRPRVRLVAPLAVAGLLVAAAGVQAAPAPVTVTTVSTAGPAVRVPAGVASMGIADPYPWQQDVTVPAGSYVRDLDVRLDQLDHTFLDEFDAVLQAPDGRAVTLMSDSCGNEGIPASSPIDVRFDDAALLGDMPLGNLGICVGGGPFRPTDHVVAGDPPLPAPAPADASADLSAFEGHPAPGGSWRMFLNDDEALDVGHLGGWTLTLRTSPPAPAGFSYAVVQGQEGRNASVTVTRAGTEGVLGAGEVSWRTVAGSAAADSDFTALSGTISFVRGQVERELLIPIRDDGAGGEPGESFAVQLTGASGDAGVGGAPQALVTIPPDASDPASENRPASTPSPRSTGSGSGAPRADQVIVLPRNGSCLVRRRLSIRFRKPTRGRVTRVQVKVNGRLARRQSGAAALRAITVAKVRPAARYSVVVRATLSTKKTLTLKRVYKACAG